MARKFYKTIDGEKPPGNVVLVEPEDSTEFVVYSPPGEKRLAWTETFTDRDEAMRLARSLAKEISQDVVFVTHDTKEWWLVGLQEDRENHPVEWPTPFSPMNPAQKFNRWQATQVVLTALISIAIGLATWSLNTYSEKNRVTQADNALESSKYALAPYYIDTLSNGTVAQKKLALETLRVVLPPNVGAVIIEQYGAFSPTNGPPSDATLGSLATFATSLFDVRQARRQEGYDGLRYTGNAQAAILAIVAAVNSGQGADQTNGLWNAAKLLERAETAALKAVVANGPDKEAFVKALQTIGSNGDESFTMAANARRLAGLKD